MSLPTEWTPLEDFPNVECISGFMTGDPVGTLRLRCGEASTVISAAEWMVSSFVERMRIVARIAGEHGYVRVRKAALAEMRAQLPVWYPPNFRREVAESGVNLKNLGLRGARAVARFAAAASRLRDRA